MEHIGWEWSLAVVAHARTLAQPLNNTQPQSTTVNNSDTLSTTTNNALADTTMAFYAPSEVLVLGFRWCNGLPNDHDGELRQKDSETFKSVCGTRPSVIAYIWHDIIENFSSFQGLLCSQDKSDVANRPI